MPSRISKVSGLSAALATLGASASLTPSAAAAGDAEAAVAPDAGAAAPMLQIPVGEDLMNFVVGEGDNSTIIADHSSHASHSSHSSHHSGR